MDELKKELRTIIAQRLIQARREHVNIGLASVSHISNDLADKILRFLSERFSPLVTEDVLSNKELLDAVLGSEDELRHKGKEKWNTQL